MVLQQQIDHDEESLAEVVVQNARVAIRKDARLTDVIAERLEDWAENEEFAERDRDAKAFRRARNILLELASV